MECGDKRQAHPALGAVCHHSTPEDQPSAPSTGRELCVPLFPDRDTWTGSIGVCAPRVEVEGRAVESQREGSEPVLAEREGNLGPSAS